MSGWAIVIALQAGYRVRATVRSLQRESELRTGIGGQVDTGDRLTVVVADLTVDAGWDAAVDGCTYVLHVASDMGMGGIAIEQLLGPARDGTLRVIRASIRAKVRRIVVTSAALTLVPATVTDSTVLDESSWAEVGQPGQSAYTHSKIVAERAAWDAINSQTSNADAHTTLTTIVPTLLEGPLLFHRIPRSVQVVSRLLQGTLPAIPRIGFNIVDVRDCAAAHVKAMALPAAAGQRYIVTSGDWMWLSEIAALLREHLGEQASKVPTRMLWDWLARFAALFSGEAKFIAQLLNQRQRLNTSKAEAQLAFRKSRSAQQTILDTAQSLIVLGVLK